MTHDRLMTLLHDHIHLHQQSSQPLQMGLETLNAIIVRGSGEPMSWTARSCHPVVWGQQWCCRIEYVAELRMSDAPLETYSLTRHVLHRIHHTI